MKSSEAENVFINIPASYNDFEIFTYDQDARESQLLKQKPTSSIDQIATWLVPNSSFLSRSVMVLGPFAEPIGANIIFPSGLDLSSNFGPMPSYCITISREDFNSMIECVKSNEHFFEKSAFGKRLIGIAQSQPM